MADYDFDGTKLKRGAKVIANIKGDKIREGSGSRVVANIRGDHIRKDSGSRVMFNVKGDDIREGSGSKRIAKMKDVDKAIDGPGEIVKAALWLWFVR